MASASWPISSSPPKGRLAVFGLHLGLLGRLILTSRVAPRALGVLPMVAGAAYVVDTVAQAMLAD